MSEDPFIAGGSADHDSDPFHALELDDDDDEPHFHGPPLDFPLDFYGIH